MSPVLPCAAFALAAASLGAAAVPVIPTDAMQIGTSTTFVAGEYRLPRGVAIVADGVVLDLGGAALVGDGVGSGGLPMKLRGSGRLSSLRWRGAMRARAASSSCA